MVSTDVVGAAMETGRDIDSNEGVHAMGAVEIPAGETPAQSLLECPNTSVRPSQVSTHGIVSQTHGAASRPSAMELHGQFSRKFMQLTMDYVVQFSALTNVGVDVATRMAEFAQRIEEAQGRGDVPGMVDVMREVECMEVTLEAKKRAYEKEPGLAPSAVDGGTDGSARVNLGVETSMAVEEVQLARDEACMEQEMAGLRSPSQVNGSPAAASVPEPMVEDAQPKLDPELKSERKMVIGSDTNHKVNKIPNKDVEVVHVEDEEGARIDVEEREDETTYAKYVASGIRELHPNVQEHPDPLVETASLRSVPMPALNFEHCLQEEVDSGVLSDAQLETVIYANMRFNQPERPRMGFFLGDGAGVGKGRQIAALCKQHWHDGGRRILWVSVSQDLRIDTKRDLKDVNAEHIPVHSDGSPRNTFDGVVFCTYSFLRTKLPKQCRPKKEHHEQGTIDRLEAIPASCNLGKLICWLSECPEGSLIVLDESHKAKNLLPAAAGGQPTQTGLAIMYLQERLPDAKVLYSSATGASEPRNLAYMHRLGIGGVGNTDSLVSLLVNSSTDALELAAMSLKSAGAYLGRTLSYEGAEFDLVRVKLERSFEIMYDRSSDIWACLYNVGQAFGENRWQAKFWGANQRFFKSMLMAGKVPEITRMAKDALLDGMCVVIGLQSTGEAATQHAMSLKGDDDMADLISAPRMTLTKCVQLMVRYDALVDSLDGALQNDNSAYKPSTGYPDSDRITAIIAVHKETYDLARKIMNQPSIAEIELECPEEAPDLSAEDVTRRLQDLMSQRTNLESSKIRANLEMIACKEVDEKPKLREKLEAMEQDVKALNRNIATLQGVQAELKSNRGTFGRRASSNGRPQSSDAMRHTEPPQSLLDDYQRPEPTSERMSGYTMDDLHKICHDIVDWYNYIAEKIDLPANPLDDLIHNLGGQDKVAELTGRKGGIFFDDNGNAEYRDRKASDSQFKKKDVNLYEKDLFMKGEKLVAIISDASSTGISLQADRRVKNQRRRCHITLELPWSADKAIQQFGRSHRANQESAPIYKMVVTPCGGEYRFACAASKRLASLGALLRGDRNALGAGSDLKSFDIDSDLGKRTLRKFLLSFASRRIPQGGKGIADRKLPEHMELDLDGDDRLSSNEKFLSYFFERLKRLGLEVRPNKVDCTVPTFLNRLLGFRIEEQDLMFRYFSDIMELERELMINEGTLERGILSMDVEAKLRETHLVHTNERTQSKVFHHVLMTDRGKSWDYAKRKLADVLRVFGGIHAVSEFSGFYIQTDTTSRKDKTWHLNGERVPKIKLVTVIPDEGAISYTRERQTQYIRTFTIFPNSEHPKRGKLTDDLGFGQRKASMEEAQTIWTKWFEYLDTGCSHGDNCKQRKEHGKCAMTRHADLHLLTGGLLEFFTRLHDVWSLSDFIGRTYTIQRDGGSEKRRHPLEIVRVMTDTGEPVVGYKAVSEEEMKFFKYQMLLPAGHEDDIVVKMRGTVHKDKVDERKRKEQERVQQFSKQQKKHRQPYQQDLMKKQNLKDAKRAMVGNPARISDVERITRCSRHEAIEALRNAGGSFNHAVDAIRARQETSRMAETAPRDGSFIQCVDYDGHKPGYAYQMGMYGLGYYRT